MNKKPSERKYIIKYTLIYEYRTTPYTKHITEIIYPQIGWNGVNWTNAPAMHLLFFGDENCIWRISIYFMSFEFLMEQNEAQAPIWNGCTCSKCFVSNHTFYNAIRYVENVVPNTHYSIAVFISYALHLFKVLKQNSNHQQSDIRPIYHNIWTYSLS